MATGTYGIVRPANPRTQDIDIFYSFTASREVEPQTLIQVPTNNIISKIEDPINSGNDFSGLCNLRLPTNIFNQQGFYTVYIRPKEIKSKVVDCGVLSNFTGIKGIVLDVSTLTPELSVNGAMVGYRIEYFRNGTRIPNLFRIVTSANRCEPINANLTNSNQKGIRYRYTDTGSLLFLTLTPSAAPTSKPNAVPFIGEVNQDILIYNTFFDPIAYEIEFTEHSVETLAYALYGNHTKSYEDGVYTVYDLENRIYRQYNLYEITSDGGTLLYEVREGRTEIDETKNFNNIVELFTPPNIDNHTES